jgi:hypothetical protein
LATTKTSQSPQIQGPQDLRDNELAQLRAQLAERDRQLDQFTRQLLRGPPPPSEPRSRSPAGSPPQLPRPQASRTTAGPFNRLKVRIDKLTSTAECLSLLKDWYGDRHRKADST